jgi:hypothetical protein
MTMQVGMGAWKELHGHGYSAKKKAKLDTSSIKVFHKVNYYVYYKEY